MSGAACDVYIATGEVNRLKISTVELGYNVMKGTEYIVSL